MMRLRDSASASARRSCSFFNAACCFFCDWLITEGWDHRIYIYNYIYTYSYLLSHCHCVHDRPPKRSFLVRQNHPTTISPIPPKALGFFVGGSPGSSLWQRETHSPNSACTSLRAFSRWLWKCLSFAKHSWFGDRSKQGFVKAPRLLRAIIMHTHTHTHTHLCRMLE